MKERLRQEDHEFEANLAYVARLYLKKKKMIHEGITSLIIFREK
jgi:hypothetical protein